MLAEWKALQAAPLSVRKARLVVALMDAFVDRLFTEDVEAGDVLEFRAAMAERSPELGLVMALAAQSPDVRLVTEAVAVPVENYGALSVEDFMVSLYNNHSIQRLRLALPGGERRDLLEVLGEAVKVLG